MIEILFTFNSPSKIWSNQRNPRNLSVKGGVKTKTLLPVSPGEITQRYVVEKLVKFEIRCGVSSLGRS